MKLKDDARFSTICIHAGQEPDQATGAIITPIYQTSTYVQDGLGQPHAGFEYGRTQNPTRMALERNVAAIEAGTAAFAFASGMAAIDALLTRLESGDHVLVSDNTYGGTFRLPSACAAEDSIICRHVEAGLVERRSAEHEYLFIETPTNRCCRSPTSSA
jgi:cystathionine beta-lyase/cystathionine gamma-synthase